jgi:Zn-dependent protease with chaperone function
MSTPPAIGSGADTTSAEANGPSVYFDGHSSRRRAVTLMFEDRLVLQSPDDVTKWHYADIRRADSPSGILRLSCLTAPALARLELRDKSLASELFSRCGRLDDNAPERRGVAAIIGWSLLATASIIAVILFGLPLVADRLVPLLPQSLERRLAEVAEVQLKTLFDGKICQETAGQAAFMKLAAAVKQSAGLRATTIRAGVFSSPVANAIALPGNTVYLFKGLLAKAESADEIAGILAHEFGHLKDRDSIRNMIHHGGTSFLIGLLFGDITGSSALIFASQSLVTASYSRETEQNADNFAIDVMHKLGRSPKPMGELMFRVTGKEGDNSLSILSSHPLTEDRLARMRSEDRPPTGPPLLTAKEWASLKAICK